MWQRVQGRRCAKSKEFICEFLASIEENWRWQFLDSGHHSVGAIILQFSSSSHLNGRYKFAYNFFQLCTSTTMNSLLRLWEKH
jgi:hypothetical protein